MSKRLALAPDPSAEVLKIVDDLIRQNGVLAMPTETYYALAGCALSDKAVRRVCAIKGRTGDKPILVLIGERQQLDRLVADVPRAAQVLMDRFWPGPLTLVFPAARYLPHQLTMGTETIGIRQPARRDVLQLLNHIGPLTGTSANRTGRPPVCTADQVHHELGEDVDLILDGGKTPGGFPSTLVDVTGLVRVLREGPVDRQAIQATLKESGILMPDQRSDD